MITINIDPDISRHIPEISTGECLVDNLVKKKTASAKKIAEKTASISPNSIENWNRSKLTLKIGTPILLSTTLLSLNSTMTNPVIATATPVNCTLFSLSCKNNLAKNNIAIVSIGPDKRLSFEAPILLTASYHVKIPIERKMEAGMKSFHDWKIENFFFVKRIDNKRSSVPDIAILKAEIDKGEIPSKRVRYSMRIDSIDKTNANKKTIHDLLINY